MSRSLRLVHLPVPNPTLRFAAVVTRPVADSDIVHGLGDWTQVQVFHSLPADWPGDDPTLGAVQPGLYIVRGQGVYTGLDANAIINARAVGQGATLAWRAFWLYDPTADPLPNQCPSPPACPPCPVQPPQQGCASSGGGSAWGILLSLLAGAGAGYALGRRR